jgi:molybdate transport system substrate-binding protein
MSFFRNRVKVLTLVCMLFLVASCDDRPENTEKKEILAYIGITMAKPMAEIATIMEKRRGVSVIITQGGSEDLYQSLKTARKGDLYLPGSASYREKHLSDGLLGDFVPEKRKHWARNGEDPFRRRLV